MKYRSIAFASELVVVSSWGSEATTDPKPDVRDHPEVQGALAIVDAWIDGVRDYREVPGISVGFVHDQQLVFSKGYGFANLRRKVPADADTIYSICSISKLFTAIAVMQMRDAGELTLRDPVADHLPWFDIQQAHTDAGPARIEGLLTHSSGLPRESDFPYWAGESFPFPTREAVIAQLSNQETLYPADTRFQYSNLALTLAGEIAAQRAGQPYAQYVQKAILDPLEMTDTRPLFPKKLHGKQMAIGYEGMDRARKREPVEPFFTRGITPAAGFTSTVNDLAEFASWQFHVLAGEPSTVLSANTLREMHRVHWIDPDWKLTWGLGFAVRQVDGQTVVGHGGACPGYITSFELIPKHKIAAIALTNAADGPAGNVATAMLKTIGAAVQKATKPAAEKKEASVIDLTAYSGNYGSSIWGGERAIRVWDDKLAMISLPSNTIGEITKLKHVESDVFVRVTDSGEEREQVEFQRSEAGRVTGFKTHSNVYRKL